LQHGFGETQLRVGAAQIVGQRRGVAVAVEQALQNPAHRQLQAEVLDRGLLEEGPDGLETGTTGQTTGTHRQQRDSSSSLVAQSQRGYQPRRANTLICVIPEAFRAAGHEASLRAFLGTFLRAFRDDGRSFALPPP